MPEQRAKFTAEVQVNNAIAIFGDGHTVEYGQEEMTTVAFKPGDRPNAIRPLEMVQHSFKIRKITPLQAVPNETLVAAANHGKATYIHFLNVTLEDRPELLSRKSRDVLVTLKVQYSITVRRQLDA